MSSSLTAPLTDATKRTRLSLSHGQTLIPSPDSSTIFKVPLTKSHFLDAYSKGKWNLSNVPCPQCFQGVDFISPPDHFNEVTRLNVVKRFINNEQWKDKHAFNKLIVKALKHFGSKGASISIIDEKRQVVKYQVSLNISECPKHVSIDAHTILSTGNFVLLDASKDWRTSKNPFVKGPPNIKFYCGVPLVTKFGAIIGVFAVFDPFARTEIGRKQLEYLKELADEVITILSTPLQHTDNNKECDLSLLSILGRPTSQGNQFLPVAVYEKDGSGSQYTQNFNFRFGKQGFMDSQDHYLNHEITRSISKAKDIKKAASELSKIISERHNFDLVCVVEVKVSQKYQISSEFFPLENSIEAETFNHASKLVKLENEQVISRILGSSGYRESDLHFGPSFFFASLSSEFGIYYESTPSSNVKLRSGICMPFYRMNSKIVRKNKIVRNVKIINNDNKVIDVFLRSGGYLIAAFCESETAIQESTMNFVYGSSCSLRHVFIAN